MHIMCRRARPSFLGLLLVGVVAIAFVASAEAWTAKASNERRSFTTRFALAMTTSSSAASSSAASSSAPATTTTAKGSGTLRGPALPLPEALRSTKPGTWAHDTMSRRVDGEILQRTEEDNAEFLAQHKAIRDRFQALREDLRAAGEAKLTYPDEPDTGDDERQAEVRAWKDILRPHVDGGETWLGAPWMVAEFYVYRRLMDCLGYWDADSPGYGYDPFAKQKLAGLQSSPASAEAILTRIPNLPPLENNKANTTASCARGVEIAASMALWGNKMDLSLWPADASAASTDVFSDILDAGRENLLHDDSQALAAHCEELRQKGGGQVDIIVDNAGFELVTDLALAQYLVQSGVAHTVTFQLKSHPTFVSDAIAVDLRETVDYYRSSLDTGLYPACRASGELWHEYLESGQWKCREDSFWVQGAPMWRMPNELHDYMQTRCDLAFVKGDANYRRLLGDLEWDMSEASYQDVVGAYFPCPVCALRTLKAEVGCGMAADLVKRARDLDEQWMVNGRFGVVHFSLAGRAAESKES